jgi:NTE family protein
VNTPDGAAPPPETIAALQRARAKFACTALALQGGGALGAYQAGVFEALEAADIEPDWVTGVSIGAINAAIIAGNRPENRVPRLRAFWERITNAAYALPAPAATPLHRLFNLGSATAAMAFGAPGFFTPRIVNPWLLPSGVEGATSFYDTSPLEATLDELIDWKVLNGGRVRLSIGAVNVTTGNFHYFDSAKERIGPRHIMASGALPPGFPAVEIDNEAYWDGGLVSNTPLQYLLEWETLRDTLVFQVDLFSAHGASPADMPAVLARQKEILYSSRTRANTDAFRRTHQARAALRAALKRLPAKALTEQDRAFLADTDDTPQVTILHLIYRRKAYEEQSQDYEFSAASMREHWASGHADTLRTLKHPHWLAPPPPEEAVRVHDVHREDP